MSYRRVPFVQSPLLESEQEGHEAVLDQPQLDTQDETLFENPQFVHYEQISNIQLLFDLFFVANLTTFTSQHEINSIETLSSYIGFFCILWFTWCQVTLYDVRFATDSVFERICHAAHFGVMIGLAVVGPLFDPDDTFFSTLQQLSLILMASRFVLFAQYGSTLFFIWKYRKTRLPLFLVMGTLFACAICYLGLSFAFSLETHPHAYIAWYVVAVFEVASNITIAGFWPILSFKNTHLVERMTALTLIILGEGVIGLTHSIVEIEAGDFTFSGATIGTIVAALLVIYLLYQLYFDNVQFESFGTIRQQLWAFLHFPFHLALVLLMEGTNQFIIYRHIIELLSSVFGQWDSLSQDADPQTVYDTLSTMINNTFAIFPPETNQTDIMATLNSDLATLLPSSNASNDSYEDAQASIVTTLFTAIFDGFGFEPPESGESDSGSMDPIDQLSDTLAAYYDVFELVFGYFFICAGIVVMGIGILAFLVISGDSAHHENSSASSTSDQETGHHATSVAKGSYMMRARRYFGVIMDLLLGLALTLCSIMVVTDAADTLGEGVWTLPLVVFVLAFLVVVNHWPSRLGRSKGMMVMPMWKKHHKGSMTNA